MEVCANRCWHVCPEGQSVESYPGRQEALGTTLRPMRSYICRADASDVQTTSFRWSSICTQ